MQDDIKKAWEEHWNGMGVDAIGSPGSFEAGYRAHAARSGWVSIDDPIVEVWKDGKTEVDLHVTYYDESGSHRLTDCKYNKAHDEWETPDYYLSDFSVYPTHARLPPSSPIKRG